MNSAGAFTCGIFTNNTNVGKSPDEIVRAYPHITLADVHAALAYYWDQDDIDQQMKDADEFVTELKDSNEASPLARKLAAADSGHAKTSP